MNETDARMLPIKVYRCRACPATEKSPWVPEGWIGISLYRGRPDDTGNKVDLFGLACSRACALDMVTRIQRRVREHGAVRAVEAV